MVPMCYGLYKTLKTDFREERRAMMDLMEVNRRDEARQYAEDARARPAPAGPSPEGTRQQMTAENPQDPEQRRT